jgi:thiamine biosynthesis lipoprotein
LLKLGKTFAEQSDDLINPTIGKLVALWGFHTDTPKCQPPPDAAQIKALVAANPRMKDLELEGIRLRGHNPRAQLDFSAFAVGYGIDLAVNHLREMGIQNAVVNIGGNLRAIGDRDGQPWRIAIRRPSGTGVFAIVEVSGDESLFTASDYERNYTYEGKTYHHLIDYRTGYPAAGSHAVTVLHREAAIADAAATALFVAGPEHWFEIAKRMGVRYVLLMDSNGTVHMTPAMAKRIEILSRDQNVKLSAPL